MCTFHQLAGFLEAKGGHLPPLAFPVSPPHLLMLKAGAFHRLPPLPKPGGESHQLLAGPGFGGWAALHLYLQLTFWLTVLAACQPQQAHIVNRQTSAVRHCDTAR